jgi:parallel beta-helix repeat protein
VNVWDDSYPSGGNYWSDYGGSDANGDGIGDTPYVIDADNQDRYPLMHPWSPLPVHNMNTGLGYTTIQEAINAPDTLDRHAIFVEAGTYYEHVVVNKAVRLVGEGRENTIIDGGGAGTCVNMMANDVVINGFTTRNSGNFPDSGIRAHGRVNVTIQNNNIVYNWFGIYLYESSNNTIFHNNFINNTNQVYVRTTGYVNTWDDGYPSGGNYWSDYVGVDVKFGPGQDLPGSDGIGDTPYNIDADNIDHYPLMNPYGAPPPPTYTLTITTTTGGTTNPTPGTYTYTANSSVQVTAIPEANYLFDHWELDTANVGSANSYIVIMDKDHTLKAVFSPIPPPLSASINPLSASINVGQSVTFTSTVSGGHTPYTYQWYLNGALVSGATSNTWTFTPTTSGIYYIHLKVTDAKDNTTQSETARITVAAVPVGGYSIPIKGQNTPNPLTLYLALIAILATVFTAIRRKIPNKKMTEKNKS